MERVPFLAEEEGIELADDFVSHKKTYQSLASGRLKSSRLRQILRTCFTIIEVCLTLAWVFSWVRSNYGSTVKEGNVITPHTNNSRVEQCAPTNAFTVKAPRANVWKYLDVDEVVQIRTWLDQRELGLNLTRGDKAGLKWVVEPCFRVLALTI